MLSEKLLEIDLLSEAVNPRVNTSNVNALYELYIRVESSNVHSIYYNPDDRILRVRFLSGAEYEYYNVSARIFIALLNAPSHGKEFWRKVRDIYSYTRLANWDTLDIESETIAGDSWDRYQEEMEPEIEEEEISPSDLDDVESLDDLEDLGFDLDDLDDTEDISDDDIENMDINDLQDLLGL